MTAASVGANNDQRQKSARKEPAPIIINKDEQFAYKAPSTVHETVVHTLRREKDNLSVALSNQRESANAMAARMTQMGIRMAELERANEQLLAVQTEDKNALMQLDSQYQNAMAEVRQLRAQIAEERLQVHRARDGET
jgi:septal ring factor EnvC (AmiA/AmiB activator)